MLEYVEPEWGLVTWRTVLISNLEADDYDEWKSLPSMTFAETTLARDEKVSVLLDSWRTTRTMTPQVWKRLSKLSRNITTHTKAMVNKHISKEPSQLKNLCRLKTGSGPRKHSTVPTLASTVWLCVRTLCQDLRKQLSRNYYTLRCTNGYSMPVTFSSYQACSGGLLNWKRKQMDWIWLMMHEKQQIPSYSMASRSSRDNDRSKEMQNKQLMKTSRAEIEVLCPKWKRTISKVLRMRAVPQVLVNISSSNIP